MVSTWLNVLDVVLDIQISRYRLIYPSTKDYEGLLSLVEFLPERNMERDCVEICSFSLSLSCLHKIYPRRDNPQGKQKKREEKKKEKHSKDVGNTAFIRRIKGCFPLRSEKL